MADRLIMIINIRKDDINYDDLTFYINNEIKEELKLVKLT